MWSESCEENVLATNKKFDCHKAPTFHNLRLTTNGFSERKKKWVKNVIENGGGSYDGYFHSSTTDVVITKRDTVESPKVLAALNAQKVQSRHGMKFCIDCLHFEHTV